MLEASVAGLFGLLIGSFLNVCIYRLPRDLSVVAPRSYCPSCEKQIAWFDNIPVLTWILLRGRCRHCNVRIPLRYPAVELLTGVLFFYAVAQHGWTVHALKLCVFFAIQVALLFTDLEIRLLPDEFTIGGLVAGLGLSWFVMLPQLLTPFFFPDASDRMLSLAESVFAALFIAGTLWSIGTIYGRLRGVEALGLGDVKMIAMVGAFLGIQGVLFTLTAGALAGTVAGLGYILITRKDWREYPLPFGTFLAAAAILAALR